MVPQVGQKIGPYEILGRLGSGGMGLVFSAWDARLHRDVAIKLLKDEFLNSTMRSRFLGEARAASRLNHPNICTVFDIGEEDGSPYLVMELLKGETLRGRMQKGPIPVETIMQVATQVADALGVAHEQGIVHRDIKPANVVLVDKPNGTFQTKVLDFGLAKVDIAGFDSHTGLTTTGMTVGTVSYMSPEQARGELLDGRSDLFALGVLLYEMATKKLPFDGATSALVFVQLLNHPPEPLRTLNANVPKALEQVINTCLQKNRDDRYQTAHEMVEALQKAAQNMGSGEKSASWFAKFTTGLRRDSSATDAPTAPQSEKVEPAGEAPSPRQLSPDEAFLRPFRPGRKPSSESERFEPVNAPYSSSENVAVPSPVVSLGELASEHNDEAAVEVGIPPIAVTETTASRPEQRASSAISRDKSLDWLDEPVEAPSHDRQPVAEEDTHSWHGWRTLIGFLFAAATVAISVAVVLSKRHAAAVKIVPTVELSLIANHTGDNVLGGVMSAGLALALQQSPLVALRGNGSRSVEFASDLPKKGDERFGSLQRAGKAGGATAFALGEIHMEGPTYVFSLHVYDTARGNAIGECASTAVSRERIIGAIDGLATNLRSVLGESGATLAEISAPLARQATANIDALSSYSTGEALLAEGRLFDAADAFEHAASLDSRFPQASLRLAEIYRRQHAEVSAADAANRAAAAANGDDRTKLLAAGMQSLLTTGDFEKAAMLFSQVAQRYKSDPAGFIYLAITQRQEGDDAAALASAQEAVRIAPTDSVARSELKKTLLALNDPSGAGDEHGARASGLASSADQLVSFLRGTLPKADVQSTSTGSDDLDVWMTEAEILDASGQLSAGLAQWKSIQQRTASFPKLSSSASFALAEAALDRALLGDCTDASKIVREASAYEAGPRATFNMGLASGICGNLDVTRDSLAKLGVKYQQSFAMKAFYASDLSAVMQWKSGALADALVTLRSATDFDGISLTPYLRGLVYLAQKQPQSASVDLQSMLRNPGKIVLVNAAALPAAQVELARAFIANGDVQNATQAYRRAANMLQRADTENATATEVRLAVGPLP